MTDKTEVTEIPLNKIKAAPWQPRELFDKDKIKSLGESLKEKGIIQPIVVRKDKTGEGYELIAGERRFRAWSYTGKNKIPAIIKDVDDFEARELSIIENWHREDLSSDEGEKYIRDLWYDGLKEKRYTSYSDMQRKTGIANQIISSIISADKERWELKSSSAMETKEIKNVSYGDMNSVRAIGDIDTKAELLKTRVLNPNLLPQKVMENVVRVIKNEPSETQLGVIKLISSEKLEPKNVERFVKVLKESPEDIQQKLLKQEITPEEAESVKMFKTPEQRAQVLEEKKILRQDFKDQEERHVAVRKQMADDVEEGKTPTILHPRFDLTGSDEEASAKRTLERYQNIHIEVLSYRADHILSIKNKGVQDQCIDVVKKTLAHCNEVLHGVDNLKTLIKYR